MAEAETDRKKTHRSPAYPAITLDKALGYAQTIYKREKRSQAPVAVVAQHCGSDIKSSKGLRIIAALKQFGLVVEVGAGDDRQVKLSDRSLDILLAEADDSPERLKAIEEAALTPPTYRKTWDHFGGELPSDATLQSYLLRQLDFNDAYVKSYIKNFRATLAFAKVTKQDTIEGSENDSDLENEDSAMESTLEAPKGQSDKPKTLPPPAAGLKDFPLYTSAAKGALYAPATMKKADFDLFKKQVENHLLVIEATSVVAE